MIKIRQKSLESVRSDLFEFQGADEVILERGIGGQGDEFDLLSESLRCFFRLLREEQRACTGDRRISQECDFLGINIGE